MARVIAIANQKGGVAKTTTTHTLSCALVERGRTVLLVDADAQGNLTAACGEDPDALAADQRTLSHVLAGNTRIEDAIVDGSPALLGCNSLLNTVNEALVRQDTPPTRLRDYLHPIVGRYDYILIDCGPGITRATQNAMSAADQILIPTKLDDRSIDGIKELLRTIERLSALHNPRLRVLGLLPTIYDRGYRSERDHLERLQTEFGHTTSVFDPIPRTGWINNQVSRARTIITSRPSIVSARNYAELARRIDVIGSTAPMLVEPQAVH